MTEENFKWDLFSFGQCEIIRELLAKGEYNNITAAVRVETPEQEQALEELLANKRPVSQPLESKVRADLETALAKDTVNTVIDTPEKEAEWQAKIDAEKVAHAEKVKSKKKKYTKE